MLASMTMLARPEILSLFTTRRCTAACDHCAIGGNPRATGEIPVSRLHGLIDEAKRVPSLRRIAFTGGECFLLGRDLDALIAHAHALGFETRVITNGYWAVNERAARDRAAALRAAGLDEMMLSTGTFHQQFVPVERIVHAARATAAAGIPVLISVEACDQSSFDAASLDDALAPLIAEQMVRISHAPWITDAGGRGSAELSHARVRELGLSTANERCAQVLTVVSVTPNQTLTACCGFPMEELPALRIGSVAERPLDEVLAGAPNDVFKMWLHVAGPAGIAEFVSRHIPGYELPEYASVCEACAALQRDPRAMAVVVEHAVDVIESIASQFVAFQRRPEPDPFTSPTTERRSQWT
jgi:pyruvate-formate lyase-activating enzyme